MAPKAKQQQTGPKKGNANKGSSKNVNDSDDDDALLAAATAKAADAAKTLNAQKAAADAKKAKLEAEAKAQLAASIDAAKKLPPVDLTEAAKFICDSLRVKLGGTLRDAVWATYVFHRFIMQVVEKHRRISLKVTTADGGEKDMEVKSFEVHDDKHPGDNHSWNVFTLKDGEEGVYVLDLSLDQFVPSGRYGYRKDNLETEGWVPVKAVSRIVEFNAPENSPAHAGVLGLDAGILHDGRIEVADGVRAGSHDAYVRFLVAAGDGRHKNMTADERSVAEILQRNRSVPLWLDLHARLEDKFFAQTAVQGKP